MDQLAVSFCTTKTKQQSKQQLEKNQPEPIKARVHATTKNQMVLAFFDSYVHQLHAKGENCQCPVHH
jgi:hypothetical protein